MHAGARWGWLPVAVLGRALRACVSASCRQGNMAWGCTQERRQHHNHRFHRLLGSHAQPSSSPPRPRPRAVFERCEYWRLRDSTGKPAGLLGWWPSRSVTFLENHDTVRGAAAWHAAWCDGASACAVL